MVHRLSLDNNTVRSPSSNTTPDITEPSPDSVPNQDEDGNPTYIIERIVARRKVGRVTGIWLNGKASMTRMIVGFLVKTPPLMAHSPR